MMTIYTGNWRYVIVVLMMQWGQLINAKTQVWPLGNISVGFEGYSQEDAIYPPVSKCFPLGDQHPDLPYKSLLFNGKDYVDVHIGRMIPDKTEFTIVVHIYPQSPCSNCTLMEYESNTTVTGYSFSFKLITDRNDLNLFVLEEKQNFLHFQMPGLLIFDTWMRLLLTMDATTKAITVYVDDRKVGVFPTNMDSGMYGRIRLGMSFAESGGYLGFITCLYFLNKVSKVASKVDELSFCSEENNWYREPEKLCGRSGPSHVFPLTKQWFEYYSKNHKNLTIHLPECPRWAEGPTVLQNDALMFDGSFMSILDINVPRDIPQTYSSLSFFVYIEVNWAGTLLDAVISGQNSSYRMVLRVSNSGCILLSVSSGRDEVFCGEVSVPATTNKWTIIYMGYTPPDKKLTLYHDGVTNTTIESCTVSIYQISRNGILRIGGHQDDIDNNFRGRLTCLVFFRTNHNDFETLEQIMSENCVKSSNFKENNCKITSRSSFYKLEGENKKPSVNKSPIFIVSRKKRLHCATLCTKRMNCRSFVVDMVSKEMVICNLFDFVEKVYLTPAIGNEYYVVVNERGAS